MRLFKKVTVKRLVFATAMIWLIGGLIFLPMWIVNEARRTGILQEQAKNTKEYKVLIEQLKAQIQQITTAIASNSKSGSS